MYRRLSNLRVSRLPETLNETSNIDERHLFFATIEETKAPQVGQPTVHFLVGRRVRYLVAPPKKIHGTVALKSRRKGVFLCLVQSLTLCPRGTRDQRSSRFWISLPA